MQNHHVKLRKTMILYAYKVIDICVYFLTFCRNLTKLIIIQKFYQVKR